MEQSKYLGIYIESEKTTVVLAARAEGKMEVLDFFTVISPMPQQTDSAQPQPKFSYADVAREIVNICAEKKFSYSDVAIAIDCRLYRQQKLHSEFQDYRQISQTIKFDAEEALAVDAAQTAIAFEILGKQTSGSDVSVFAVSSDFITEIIKSLQANKIDPVIIEPDAICLRRVIDDNAKGAIVAAVSQTRCFMIHPSNSDDKAIVRSFITSPAQNKTSLFSSQIMLTMSTLGAEGSSASVKVFDTTGSLNISLLHEQTSLPAQTLDINQKITLPSAENLRDGQALEVIIAAGAAGALLSKTGKVDFRGDFMPYQGKKIIVEKTVKMVGVICTAAFLFFGILLQLAYMSSGKDIKKIDAKFKSEYVIAMPGAKYISTRESVRRLKSEINKIKDIKSGMLSASGEDSIEAKMTYLFEALNNVPKNIDIDVDKIAVTTKTMNFSGSTNLGGHLQLFGAFDKHAKLNRGASTYEPKDGRDNFRLTIDLKQGGHKE